jgi:hypothetical protein
MAGAGRRSCRVTGSSSSGSRRWHRRGATDGGCAGEAQRGSADAAEGGCVGAGGGAGAAKVFGERRRCTSGELGHGGGETQGVRRGRGRKREEREKKYMRG